MQDICQQTLLSILGLVWQHSFAPLLRESAERCQTPSLHVTTREALPPLLFCNAGKSGKNPLSTIALLFASPRLSSPRCTLHRLCHTLLCRAAPLYRRAHQVQPVIVVVTETEPAVVFLLVPSPCTIVAFPSSSSGLGVGVVEGAPPKRCGTSGELELERTRWVGRSARTDPQVKEDNSLCTSTVLCYEFLLLLGIEKKNTNVTFKYCPNKA